MGEGTSYVNVEVETTFTLYVPFDEEKFRKDLAKTMREFADRHNAEDIFIDMKLPVLHFTRLAEEED